MRKFHKHIAFSLILNLLLFSSGQAYILSDCKCDHSDSTIIESTNCCGEVLEIEVEETDCCTSFSGHNEVKFESATSHSCTDCFAGCSLYKNIDYSAPTLFAYLSFSLQKLEKMEIESICLSSDKFNTLRTNNIFIQTQNEETPKLFGINLLIHTHTLKIPLILV